MPHVIESAPTGRAKCRGCGRKIAKDELRFGERTPSAFAAGEMTLWFHLRCAAFKRPEPLLETLADPATPDVPDAGGLRAAAEQSLAHRRLPRLNGAERAPTGRATCRSCRERIERDSWRIALVYFEEARFEPSGFIHAGCAGRYFETTDLLDRIRHFSHDLGESDVAELAQALA